MLIIVNHTLADCFYLDRKRPLQRWCAERLPNLQHILGLYLSCYRTRRNHKHTSKPMQLILILRPWLTNK